MTTGDPRLVAALLVGDPLEALYGQVARLHERVAILERNVGIEASRAAAWQPVTFTNSFVDSTDPTVAPASYYRDTLGRVWLRGEPQKTGPVDYVSAFTLPEGYRPAFRFTQVLDTSGRLVEIRTNGEVLCYAIAGGTQRFPLESFTFRTT